jgi:luciferase-type oxidoreductase
MWSSENSSALLRRLFAPDRLSIGLSLPLLGEGHITPDVGEQLALARQADDLGFAALWVRDVPLNSADYPDPVGHLDPWVFLGALAAQTRRIALISGAIVLTLRHPLHIAKGAVSVNAMSGGRFILGLGSGDRPPEYAAFGRDPAERRKAYARHWEVVAAALGESPKVLPDEQPEGAPDFFLLPQAAAPTPMLAVGSGGQSVDWIARNAIGWMTYHREPEQQRARYQMWRNAVERATPGAFKMFGTAMRLELSDHADEAPTPINLGYRSGSKGLVAVLDQMRASGTHHVTLALSGITRPLSEVLEELAAQVLPAFHAKGASSGPSFSTTRSMKADTASGRWRRLGYSTFSPKPLHWYCGSTGTSKPACRSSEESVRGSKATPRPATVALRKACAVLPLKRGTNCTSSSTPSGPVRRQVLRPLACAKLMQS